MKTRIFTTLAIALLLIATLTLPAVAVTEGSSPASVTISSLVDITITDSPTAGIHFGTMSLGQNDKLDEDAGAGTPSISILNSGSDNTTVQIKGTDFGASFPVTNASYALSYGGARTALSTTYTTFMTNLTPGSDVDIWHYLDVPSTGVASGGYSSTFSYKTL